MKNLEFGTIFNILNNAKKDFNLHMKILIEIIKVVNLVDYTAKISQNFEDCTNYEEVLLK